MATENEISIASKSYGARRTAMQLYGDRYEEKTAEYRSVIESAMKKHNCDVLPAAIKVMQFLIDGHYGGIPVMLTLAAAVDMIEPLVNSCHQNNGG